MSTLDESWWVRVLAGPGGDLHSQTAQERYVALPNASDPRVVVDGSSRRAVRDAVERFVASRTSNAFVRSLAGRSSGALTLTKGTWKVSPSPSSPTLRTHLSDVLGQEVQLSVAVGPPRPNQKPVIRCYGAAGLIAVAKLGPDSHTAAMVSNESHWLRTFAEVPLGGVLTPKLVHAGAFGGSTLLVMAAMDLTSDLGVGFGDVPTAVIRELSGRFRESGGLGESIWWKGLAGRLGHRELSMVAELARRTPDHPHFTELETSVWHGDWSPWNMGYSPDGELFVWDWERTTTGVPVGFDLLHLHFQYGSGLDGALDDLSRLDVSKAHHDLMKTLYLLEVCARHADAGVLHGEQHTRTINALNQLHASGLTQ